MDECEDTIPKISFVKQRSDKTLKKMAAGLKEHELSESIHVDFELYNEQEPPKKFCVLG